ncbi:hypothetical protein [Zobellia alginiliquefaciens]|uniref:hypothetical protein n=1 Tax=Zobellia alginiliquefaciens TaxID=3032586 RepID=UPI0023E38258|nr:hypothetical protein [Zobellia alginiliquefaciens]
MSRIQFVPGVWPRTLTPQSKRFLKDLIQFYELAKFIKWYDLVGYTPNPDGPDDRPWPWPGPPPLWKMRFGGPDPQPNLPSLLQGELLIKEVVRSNGDKESSSFIDVMKREGIAQEAFDELLVDLADVQKSIELQKKALG